MRKIALFVFGAIALLVVGVIIAGVVLNEEKPTGQAGEEADRLAQKMIGWTNPEGWAQTRAVRWSFAGRFDHLWDRDRGYDRVSWGPYVALVRLADASGVVRADGQVVEPERAKELLQTAYERWVNDSFWLNPFDGLFDATTRRELVQTEDRGAGLLVTYGSGGVTPGDSYLWFAQPDGQPTAWKMWVDIIPIGGLEASWDEWTALPTGAKISTLHKGPIELKLEVNGARTLTELLDGAPDPFAELDADRPPPASPASAPADAPASAPGDAPRFGPRLGAGRNAVTR